MSGLVRISMAALIGMCACGEEFVEQDPDGDGGGAGATELTTEGLVARYFIDEAAAGQPPRLMDAADSPIDLSVTYDGDPSFTEIDGHRGLAWTQAGGDGRASVAIDGTKVRSQLDGSTRATIELVVDLTSAVPGGSRLLWIGTNQEAGRLGLRTTDARDLSLYLNGDELVGVWTTGLATAGRSVVHCVVDTEQYAPEDRTRLFVNGSEIPRQGDAHAGQDQPITIEDGRYLVLGNREIGQRSFAGKLYYAALYAAVLDDDAVADNARLLMESDDEP